MINIIWTNLAPNLTARVLFPAILSVSVSLILFIHSNEVDRLPKIIPAMIDSWEIDRLDNR